MFLPAFSFNARRAFTLIELLVVMAIIAVLAALIFPTIAKMKDRAKHSREVNAARQIMVGFAGFAAANNGQFVSGYDSQAEAVTLSNGTEVSGVMCARYPWRLAPYLGENIDEVFLINETKGKTAGMRPDSFEYQYEASLHPALGINGYCVGGYNDGSTNFQKDVIRSMGSNQYAGRIIAFISARFTEGGGEKTVSVPGFHTVKPPRFFNSSWMGDWDRKKAATTFGYVDMRWDDKATCAFLDGHVEMLGDKELRDMRHWSNQANEDNNPNFIVPR